MDILAKYGLEPSSLGIVTPYRDQVERVRSWAGDKYGEKILVGTAHQFQGDERDMVIFSPVLSSGIHPGSLRWLEEHRNLLNVAVTRARLTLLIVGNWEFCHNLPMASKYRRLADYAKSKKRVIQEISQLFSPEISHIPYRIAGTILNPHDKNYNRMTLRRFVSSCQSFVWWIDPFFQNQVLDFFLDLFEQETTTITDVRLLTITNMTESEEGKKPNLDIERVKSVTSELRRRGVSFELRLLPKNQLTHDRFLYSADQCINMPPFGGAIGSHKQIAEYTESHTTPEFFEEFWSKAPPLS